MQEIESRLELSSIQPALHLILAHTYGSDITDAFLDIRSGNAGRVFRVAFLLHCGGLWIDAATSLLRPVESWMDRRHSFQMLRRSHQEHPRGYLCFTAGFAIAQAVGMKWFRLLIWNKGLPRRVLVYSVICWPCVQILHWVSMRFQSCWMVV